MDTLFSTKELSPEALDRRRIVGTGLKLLGGAVGVSLVGSGAGVGYRALTGKNPLTLLPASESDLQLAVLTYMDGGKYSNPDFGRQITGTDATFMEINDGQVYFTLPAGLPKKAETLERLAKNPQHVRHSQFVRGRERLDDYVARPGLEIISMQLSDFKVDPNRKIVIKYSGMPFKTNGELFYDVTVLELDGFLRGKKIYGGPEWADGGRLKNGKKFLLPNLGRLVAGKGEQSLERLVLRIVDSKESIEKQIAKLNVFVANAIPYDKYQANNGLTYLKRPNETLMTDKAICNSKVILLASLLEQIGANYQILYLFEDRTRPGHTQIAVAGVFPKNNGLGIKIDGIEYAIAETTVPGFFIGATHLTSYTNPEFIKYRQRPGMWGFGMGPRIVQISNGQKLRWDRATFI